MYDVYAEGRFEYQIKKMSKNYTISIDICVDNDDNSLDRHCWAWMFGNGKTNIYKHCDCHQFN